MAEYIDSTGRAFTVGSVQMRVGTDNIHFEKFKPGENVIDQTQVFRVGDRFPAAVVTGACKAGTVTGSIPAHLWLAYTRANPAYAKKRVTIVVTLVESEIEECKLEYEDCKLSKEAPADLTGGEATEVLVDVEWQPRRAKFNGSYAV